MRCQTHDLAVGSDGKCALCRSRERKLAHAGERSRDPARRVALVVVGVAALVAAYAVITAIADTKRSTTEEPNEAGPRTSGSR